MSCSAVCRVIGDYRLPQHSVITAQDAREARGEGSPGEQPANITPAALLYAGIALSGLGVP